MLDFIRYRQDSPANRRAVDYPDDFALIIDLGCFCLDQTQVSSF
jgi:hypothetical protein